MKYLSFLFLFVFISISSNRQKDDWTSYGKDSGAGHYSKATEITRENIKNKKSPIKVIGLKN